MARRGPVGWRATSRAWQSLPRPRGARSGGTGTSSLHTGTIPDQVKAAWVGTCPDFLLPPRRPGAGGRDGSAMGSCADRDRPSAGRTAYSCWLPGGPARPSRCPGPRCAPYGGPSSEAGGRAVLSLGRGDTGQRDISSTTG